MIFRARSAFTLLEMMLACVLSALLMGGVLLMTGAMARERARVTADESKPRATQLLKQLRWDLTNATTIAQLDNGRELILNGHGGLDARSLAPTGRLTRVIYEVRGHGRDTALFRRQDYLDEPARPETWTELVGMGVLKIYVMPRSGDAEPVEKEVPQNQSGNPDTTAHRQRDGGHRCRSCRPALCCISSAIMRSWTRRCGCDEYCYAHCDTGVPPVPTAARKGHIGN